MALLIPSEFEARYGDIARRLFDFDQWMWARPENLPNLIFRRPLDWPVIPLPGEFDDMCQHADEQRNLENWLSYLKGELFYDSVVPGLYRWYFERQAGQFLWAPLIDTLARHGPGRAVVFEPEGHMMRVGDWPGWKDPSRAEGWPARMTDEQLRAAALWTGPYAREDWRAGEDTIAEGLSLQFEGWRRGCGDCVCLIDDTADWALHSWGECDISYLTAEPALMAQVLEAVGGPEIVGKFFSLDCGMTYEFMDSLESILDVFGKPPFIEMPLRVIRSLDEHLEAHPWLDKAFADL